MNIAIIFSYIILLFLFFYSEAAMMMKTDYRTIVSKSLPEMITSDYLTTILCFVPVAQEKTFVDNYTTYSKFVLDESAM